MSLSFSQKVFNIHECEEDLVQEEIKLPANLFRKNKEKISSSWDRIQSYSGSVAAHNLKLYPQKRKNILGKQN